MTTIGATTIARSAMLPALQSAAAPSSLGSASSQPNQELREAFTQFVGETFYGQMIKAMRSTVGKPAYFHGGQAEEIFRGQLDQQLAEYMTEASAERFADPLFARQFPKASASLDASKPQLGDLSELSRR